jgi:hypothetical protein
MPESKFHTEEFFVNGEEILAKIKQLVHEGNIRRIIIRDREGRTYVEFPLSVGVAGVILAPALAGIGAIAALLNEATIVVEKTDP